MSQGWTILAASFSDAPERATAIQSALDARWDGAPLRVETTAIEDLAPEELAAYEAIILDPAGAPQLRAVAYLVREIEERGVPVLTLVDVEDAAALPGLLTLAGADDPQLTGVLRGVLHRHLEVEHLRRDLAIAQRCHGGIRGEITRIHEELQLAATMQREFLPASTPPVHGVEFGALWRPAHYVSGDIYSVHALDDDHVGVFLADCVGHGVPAALMTMLICRSLATSMMDEETGTFAEPDVVLTRINDDLVRRKTDSSRFATAVYGVINCRTRELRLAGAGHPPPLVVRDGHPTRELLTNGGLLGIFEGASFDQTQTWLELDERLHLYSDGFEQAFPEVGTDAYDQRLPTARYRTEFEQLARCRGAAEAIETLSGRLNDQQGSLHQADDLTFLCVHAGALVSDDATPVAQTATPRAEA